MVAPLGARNATCNTARFSVMLIFSPLNMALMRDRRPDSFASFSNSLSVSFVMRFFEKSRNSPASSGADVKRSSSASAVAAMHLA